MRRATALMRKVEKALQALGVAGGLVVAVSGGPDSVALLCAVRDLRPRLDGPLIAVHLNHQLRGTESDADEEFVRELCARHGIDCVCERIAVRSAAEGTNLESTARTLRYEALAQLARIPVSPGWRRGTRATIRRKRCCTVCCAAPG